MTASISATPPLTLLAPVLEYTAYFAKESTTVGAGCFEGALDGDGAIATPVYREVPDTVPGCASIVKNRKMMAREQKNRITNWLANCYETLELQLIVHSRNAWKFIAKVFACAFLLGRNLPSWTSSIRLLLKCVIILSAFRQDTWTVPPSHFMFVAR